MNAVVACPPKIGRSSATTIAESRPVRSLASTSQVDPSSADDDSARRREARMSVFQYIEGFYNPRRRHSGLDYLSPINDERLTPLPESA